MTGFELNYANIIAFPVLLGVGVAFKNYYITAWRKGETDFLQSALTRARSARAKRLSWIWTSWDARAICLPPGSTALVSNF